VLTGGVKNITGLRRLRRSRRRRRPAHVTDIAWRRINHLRGADHRARPSRSGRALQFETQRISLGMKQLEADPWQASRRSTRRAHRGSTGRYNLRLTAPSSSSSPHRGAGPCLRDELDQEERHPGKIVRPARRSRSWCWTSIRSTAHQPRPEAVPRQSLGELPGEAPGRLRPRRRDQEHHRVRPVRRAAGEIDGNGASLHIDWQKSGEQAIADYKKGDMVRVKSCSTSDFEKERISLGISSSPTIPLRRRRFHKEGRLRHLHGERVQDGGIEVTLGDGMTAFIRRSDLSRDRSEQRPTAFRRRREGDARSPRSIRPAARSRVDSRAARSRRRSRR